MKRIGFRGWVMMMGVGLALGCATGAPSQQAASPPAQGAPAQGTQQKEGAVAAAKDDPNALICESISVTGSRIPKKVCRTARQIEQEREDAEKAIRGTDRTNRDWNQ